MTLPETRPTRRRWLQQAGLAMVAAPALAALAAASASAAGKTSKADVGYQFTPHGDQHCGACTSFIPGENRQGPGTCKIVDGPIPPNGWCSLFSKR